MGALLSEESHAEDGVEIIHTVCGPATAYAHDPPTWSRAALHDAELAVTGRRKLDLIGAAKARECFGQPRPVRRGDVGKRQFGGAHIR